MPRLRYVLLVKRPPENDKQAANFSARQILTVGRFSLSPEIIPCSVSEVLLGMVGYLLVSLVT